jgi:tetratricopeptide (TPR) repeat protein
MRRIVFFGNCYAATLEGVYAASIAPLGGEQCSYLSCYSDDDSGNVESIIRDADVIVEQVFDVDQKITIDPGATNAKIVRFPTVSMGFLWPYGLVPHIKNFVPDYWQCGPYDYLLGDSYLNRKIDQGVEPRLAVEEYLELDIAKHAHLDRLCEIMLDRQRTRDAACDMHFADAIEASFRSEYLFLNPYRPNARMAAKLARAVFGRLGVDRAVIERITSRWRQTPFERTALPIHPKVARHFGLSYGHADQLYPYHTGERLSFADYALRYADFRWNERLLKGVATIHWGGKDIFQEFAGPVSDQRIDFALADLEEGLAASAGSALGERAVGALLLRKDRPEEALSAFERAICLDPGDAEAHHAMASLLQRQGRHHEAEAAFRAAIEQDPALPAVYADLARLLEELGRPMDAISAAEVAVELRPGFGFYAFDLARLYTTVGRLADAKVHLARAIDLLPDDDAPKLRLAAIHIDEGDLDSAERLLTQTSARGGDAADLTARLAAAGRRTLFTAATLG